MSKNDKISYEKDKNLETEVEKVDNSFMSYEEPDIETSDKEEKYIINSPKRITFRAKITEVVHD